MGPLILGPPGSGTEMTLVRNKMSDVLFTTSHTLSAVSVIKWPVMTFRCIIAVSEIVPLFNTARNQIKIVSEALLGLKGAIKEKNTHG
jgi:hypothetical protein